MMVINHHLFQSASVAQTDEGHSLLLTGIVELAFSFLRQSASGLIQNWKKLWFTHDMSHESDW